MNRMFRIGLFSVLLLGALIFASACTQSPAVQNVAPGAADPAAQMLYVADSTEVLVFPLTATGSQAPSTTITGFTMAVATALDASGNLYVSDYGANSVFVLPPGATSATAATAVITASLDHPFGIAVDAKGRIYVANFGSNAVTIYAANPTTGASPAVTIIGEATGLSCPRGLAIDQQGRFYVANQPATDCTSGSNVDGTVTLYAASLANTTGGAMVNATPVATIRDLPNGLDIPVSLAFDEAGNLYVIDIVEPSVNVYAASGFVTPVATISGSNTGLTYPYGVALDAKNNIYVADEMDNSVFIYDAVGGKIPSGNVAPTATLTGQFVAGVYGVTVH